MRALRSILGINGQDKITGLEIVDGAETRKSEAILLKAQLRWTGHVIRMEEYYTPHQLLYG